MMHGTMSFFFKKKGNIR